MYKVKKAKLYEAEGEYYIDVTYLYEDDRFIKEVHIPKLVIPLERLTSVDVEQNIYCPFKREYFARFGDLMMPMKSNSSDIAYSEKILEEKVQEMTIEEIEKQLGRKIKIVGKK